MTAPHTERASTGTRLGYIVADPGSFVQPRLPKMVQLACSAVSGLLTLWVATAWINQRWFAEVLDLVILLATLVTGIGYFRKVSTKLTLLSLVPFLIPAVSWVQLLMGKAAYPYAALQAILEWTTFASIVFVGSLLLGEPRRRDFLFGLLMVPAACVTAMAIYQMAILGRYTVLPTGVPLMSSNEYAELAELLVPIALSLVLRKCKGWQWAIIVSSLMLATVVATGARVGTAIVLSEVLVFVVMSRHNLRHGARTKVLRMATIASIACVLIAFDGGILLRARLFEDHPLEHRREILKSTLHMISDHPALGVGSGCFSIVYPQYQLYASEYFVNHVHNDYTELAAEGGLVSLAIWFAFLVGTVKKLGFATWKLGCFGVMLHSLTDFPLFRPQVSGLFGLLMVAVAADSVTRKVRAASQMRRNPLMPGSE